MSNFGNNLNRLRKKEGYSQEELANKLHVTRQTISKWELEQTAPDLKDLKKISDVFNISLDELISENNINEKKVKNKKTKKILLIILLLLILIIILLFINRIYKILFIKNKIDEACNTNNFSIEKYVHTEKDFNQTIEEAYNLHFLNGKSILIKLNNENLSEIESIETLDEKEYYYINENNKTYLQLPTEKYYENKMNLIYSPIVKDNILNEIYSKSMMFNNKELISLIFNLKFKVKSEFNKNYYITNKINSIDSYILLKSSINTNKFEFLNYSRQDKDNNISKITTYIVTLNNTKNTDFELPNLLEYKKIDI